MTTLEEQIRRVQMMASGDPKWDLSPNDIAALNALLVDRERAAKVIEAARAWREVDENQAPIDIESTKYLDALADAIDAYDAGEGAG